MELLAAITAFFASLLSPVTAPVAQLETPPVVIEESYHPLTPTLQTIFSSDHSWTATLSAERKLTLIATGDIIPARVTNYKAVVQYKNPTWAIEKTADFLKNADVTLVDLEAPLLDNCPITREGMIFCGDSKFVQALTLAGVDAASLANNHTGNHGQEGLDSTERILKNAGILPFGLSNPNYLTVKDRKIAFLGYNDILWSQPVPQEVDTELMVRDIKKARASADIVIVEFHWGTEYITPPEERQRMLGRLAIDSGADLVIGNHPHWIKPIEFYKNKLITYGHGNFIFDQEWSQKTKEGVVGKYIFYDNKLVDVEYFPIEIKDYGQPYFLEGTKKEKILQELNQASLAAQE